MKITITKAETSNTEHGKISVEQSYTLDATEAFEEYTEGFTDEEKMGAAEDLDFVNISETDIISHIHNAVRGWNTIDMSINDVHISVSGPGGWNVDTMEAAKNKVKNLEIEVTAEFSYELDYTFKENLEKAVLAAVSLQDKKLKKVEES